MSTCYLKRWLRWRLSTLFGVVTVIAVFLGAAQWLGPYWVRERDLRHLRRKNANFAPPERFNESGKFVGYVEPNPAWLKRVLFGQHCEVEIDSVRFPETATDEDLRLLAHLPEITYLHLEDTQITDEGLIHIAHLTKLETLDLSRTAITDKGLRHLARMRSLKELWLEQTDVGPELRGIEKIENLRAIDVACTDIGDGGVARLAQLPHLTDVNVSFTRLTDAAVLHLGNAPSLRLLTAVCTQFSNRAGVAFTERNPDCRAYVSPIDDQGARIMAARRTEMSLSSLLKASSDPDLPLTTEAGTNRDGSLGLRRD